MHLVLILLDHVHQMLLQVGGIHLHKRGPFSDSVAVVLLDMGGQGSKDGLKSPGADTLPPAACRSGPPESASCTWRCGRARLETSGPDRASAQTTSEQQLLMTTPRLQLEREEALIPPTHVSGSLLVAEHVGVRCHDRRPWLLGDAGGLRGGFALVHQLLHRVCDAFVAQQSGANEGEVKSTANI